MITFQQMFRNIQQIAWIMMVWAGAYIVQQGLNLPIASGVLGFFIMLTLLHVQYLPLAQVEQGADLLLAELLLFFIPPVVGIIQYQDLLMHSGWRILIVITISTLLVMMCTVWTVRLFLVEEEPA